MRSRSIIFVLIMISGFIFTSCEEDDRVITPGGGYGIDWPDRTEKEDIVEILELTYEHENTEKYTNLLLKPDTSGTFPEGYIWFNQIEDFRGGVVGEEYLTRDQDIAATDWIFTHSTDLEFMTYPGSWETVETFRGKDCPDCWETIRGYKIDVNMDSGAHYIGDYYIKLVIGQDPDDELKYVLYQARDLREGVRAVKISTDSEAESLGAIKSSCPDI